MAMDFLGISYPTANSLIHGLEDLGLLQEITVQERNRIFRYEPSVRLLDIETPGG